MEPPEPGLSQMIGESVCGGNIIKSNIAYRFENKTRMVEKCQHAMEMAAIFDFRALTKVHITSIILKHFII